MAEYLQARGDLPLIPRVAGGFYKVIIKQRTHDTAELFLLGGNLNNGANAGRRYANLNNGLTNANWNIAARNSGNSVSCFVPLEGISKELGPSARN